MLFFKPNVPKLVEKKDMKALLKLITSKDSQLAVSAALSLGNLLSDLIGVQEKEKGRSIINDLYSCGNPHAIRALSEVIRSDFSIDSDIKARAAKALYHLNAKDELRAIIQELRASNRKGEALHVGLSRDLIELSVQKRDINFLEYILINGCFDMPSEVVSAYKLLESVGDVQAVKRIVENPSVYSHISKERAIYVYRFLAKRS
ncbi:MAG: hypothetical protein DYG89_29645 [Caldilinea sp. CFX5]|nr:hypothetical protein [Caldilinea sp. CFX5]